MDDWLCWLSGEPSLRRGKWSVSKACSNLKKIYYNLNFVFDTPSILEYKCTQSVKVWRMPNLTTTIKFWSWCKTSTIYALFNQVLQVLTQFHCNAKATLTGNGFPWLYAQGSEAKTTVGSSVTSAGSSFAGRVQKTRSRRCLAGSWGMKWSSPVLSVVAKSQSKLQMPSWPCVDVKTYLYVTAILYFQVNLMAHATPCESDCLGLVSLPKDCLGGPTWPDKLTRVTRWVQQFHSCPCLQLWRASQAVKMVGMGRMDHDGSQC